MRVSLVLLALLATTGCTDSTAPASELIEVESVSEATEEMSSTVTVTWTVTDENADASIEYGLTTDYGMVAPQSATGEVTLLGLIPDSLYHWRLLTTGAVSADQTFTTGPAPSDLIDATLAKSDGSEWGHYFLTSLFSEGKAQVQVLDPDLNPVWWTTAPKDFVSCAKFSLDRRAILYLEGSGGDAAAIVRVGLDGVEHERRAAPFGHHAFVELPNGDIAYLASTEQEWDGWDLLGDQVVVVSENGAQRVAWDAFDSIEPVETSAWSSTTSGLAVDWTHANSLAYDARDNTFLVSSYQLETIYSIDAEDGSVRWELGGKESDYGFTNDDGFGPQHSIQLTDRGLMIFDNSDSSGVSRAVEYDLDTKAMQATRTSEYLHPKGAWVGTLGSVARLANGGVAATWGERGEATVFTADGDVAWGANVDHGDMIFGMQVFDSFYP